MSLNVQPSSHPLTEDHYHALNSALQVCAMQDELIGRCQQAGLNVDKYVADNNRQKQFAAGVKQAFFPNRP